MAHIIVVDDDLASNEILTRIVEKLGHACDTARSLKDGMAKIEAHEYDLVLMDVTLPDGNGIEALPVIRESAAAPEVIVVTAFGDPDGAEVAIKNGAWNYLVKPCSVEAMTLTIRRALDYRRQKQAATMPKLLQRDDIVGNSPRLSEALGRIAQAAATRGNVLLVGETGTGKELFARAIHQNSNRARRRFVVVDCASLPETLVESILFGAEKGAYTGAEKERKGLIEHAHGGTLFLDEIGELPISSQKAFLRVIQERRFLPVGGKNEVEVDFRLICATNKNLDLMVRENRFREDLLFRIRSFLIEMPPLRERKEDIRRLAVHYTNKLCEIYDTGTKGFSSEFFEALTAYDWPGNVRELFNTLEETLSKAMADPTLYSYHLPTRVRAAVARLAVDQQETPKAPYADILSTELPASESFLKMSDFRNQMEQKYLEKLMRLTNGSRKEACRISGLSRTRLFELLRKHDLSKCLRQAGSG